MSEDTKASIVLLAITAILFGAIWVGYGLAISDLHHEAVKLGHAHYDASSGDWQWNQEEDEE